jgi:hypothetical protein
VLWELRVVHRQILPLQYDFTTFIFTIRTISEAVSRLA